MSILINILLAINLVIALLLIFFTLMQRPKQEGLGAAFGGGMTENMFGAQTTNVLQTITRWLAGIWFVVALLISALYARQSKTPSELHRELEKLQPVAPAPATTETKDETKAADPKAEPTAAPAVPEAPAATPAPEAPAATPAPEAAPAAPSAQSDAAPAAEPVVVPTAATEETASPATPSTEQPAAETAPAPAEAPAANP